METSLQHFCQCTTNQHARDDYHHKLDFPCPSSDKESESFTKVKPNSKVLFQSKIQVMLQGHQWLLYIFQVQYQTLHQSAHQVSTQVCSQPPMLDLNQAFPKLNNHSKPSSDKWYDIRAVSTVQEWNEFLVQDFFHFFSVSTTLFGP